MIETVNREDREEIRPGKDKNTAIDRNYINSGAFKRKFDRITDNPELNKNLYQRAKKMLNHRTGTEFEDMYWFDGLTGKEFASKTDSTEPNRVTYHTSFLHKFKNITKKVTIHNHPHSMPPSIGDYDSAYRNDYSLGVVVCHDGTVYVYTTKKLPDCDIYESLLRYNSALHFSESTAQLNALTEMARRNILTIREV
jgi:hypothetical protein